MIHQYKLNGYNIVIDVYSGSVHSVDDLAYDVISLYENTPKPQIIKILLNKFKNDKSVTYKEIEDLINDIEELKKNNQLFTQDTFSNKVNDLKKGIFQ